jgi:hypothetical protein
MFRSHLCLSSGRCIAMDMLQKLFEQVHKYKTFYLKFVGPCIVIYFYSKSNQMHNISNLFYFGTTLYMFRTVFPFIIRSQSLYIHQVYVIQVLWLLVSGNEIFHLVPARKQPQNLYDIYLMLYVQS